MFNKRVSQFILTNYEIQYLKLSSINGSRHYYQSSNNKITPSCKLNHQSQFNTILKINKNNQLYSSNMAIKTYSNLSQKTQNIEDDNNTSSTHDDNDNCDDNFDDKQFTENGYLYSILNSSNKYSATIVPPLFDQLTNDESFLKNLTENEKVLEENTANTLAPSELLKLLKSICYHAKINHEPLSDKHERLLDLLDHHTGNLTNDELWLLLRTLAMSALPIQKSKKLPALVKLENHLNEECQKRMRKDWTVSEVLMTCDMFYQMRLPRGPFVNGALKKLGTKPQKLTAENFVHYMFLLNIGRKPAINMYELEYHLESIINTYTIEELGIIGLGFFKTNTRIRNPALLNHMIKLCIENIDTIDNFIICAFMKVSRQSLQIKETEVFIKFLRAFKSRISTASTACIVHAAHAAATTLINEKEVVDLLINRFMEQATSSRLKDLERILFVLMIFKYPSNHPLYSIIIDELKNPNRKDELLMYPKTLSSSLTYLSHVGIYPLEIISEIMDPDYLHKVYDNNSFFIGREYLAIENGLKIEEPNYKGPFLPLRVISYLGKRHSAWNIDVSDNHDEFIQGNQKYVTEIIHYIKQIIGNDKIKTDQILPHHQRIDIICCIDKEANEFIAVDKIYPNLPIGAIKYPPNTDKYKWIAIVPTSYNQTYRNESEPCGTLNGKIRQLKKVGYTPVILQHIEWKSHKNPPAKKQYMSDFILGCKNL